MNLQSPVGLPNDITNQREKRSLRVRSVAAFLDQVELLLIGPPHTSVDRLSSFVVV